MVSYLEVLSVVHALVQVLHELVDDVVEVEALVVSEGEEDGFSSKQLDVQVQVQFVVERCGFGFQLGVEEEDDYIFTGFLYFSGS